MLWLRYGTMGRMTGGRDDRSRVLFYVGVAAAVLFLVTAAVVVLIQTIAPVFGATAGAPDAAIVGTMLVWAAIALGLIPASALIRHRDHRNGS